VKDRFKSAAKLSLGTMVVLGVLSITVVRTPGSEKVFQTLQSVFGSSLVLGASGLGAKAIHQRFSKKNLGLLEAEIRAYINYICFEMEAKTLLGD
jgi:hypothetical protein